MKVIAKGKPLMIFICVNERNGAHCGHYDELRALKRWIIQNGLLPHVQVTGTTCLGYCGDNRICFIKDTFYEFESMTDIKEFITNQL